MKNGKAYSTTPARATDEEIKDDLAQMRKTWDGKPYVKPASPKEVLPEFDDYSYKGRRFIGEEESSVTMSDTRYKTFLGEVFQPNQAQGEEAESSFAKPNAPRMPFMKKVVQDNQFKAEAELLLEACTARDELLAIEEVVQDNQLKDKEVESSVAPNTLTTLAPINCAVDTGAPATSRKHEISEISELTNDPLTSPLDRQIPQTENEEGPPHKKLRTANGAVNLPIPPEKPATTKKAIPARAKRTATQKAQCAGSRRVRKTARVGKASSVVDKSVAKAAPPAIPARAKTLSTNTENPAGEPAILSKGFSVVVVTSTSFRDSRKDKSPTATAPEAEDPIREIVTNQEYKPSTSSKSEDDLKKDGRSAPVAQRTRRVARKGKAPVATRKCAAPNKAVASDEEKITAHQKGKPSAAIPEVFTSPEIASTKPIALSRSNSVKRKATGLKDEIAIQQEAEPPIALRVDAALKIDNTKPSAATKSRGVKRKATQLEDKAANRQNTEPTPIPVIHTSPATKMTVTKLAPIVKPPLREAITGLLCITTTLFDILDADDTKLAPTVKAPLREATTSLLGITTTLFDILDADDALAEGSEEPVAGPREHKKKRVDTPEVRAAVPQEAGPPAPTEVDSTLTAEKPTSALVASRKRAAPNNTVASRRRYVKRKVASQEELITRGRYTPAEIGTPPTKKNPKPAAVPKRRGGRNRNAPEAHTNTQKEAGPSAAPDVDAALTTEKPTPAPATAPLRGEIAGQEEENPLSAAVSKAPVGAVEAATLATTSAPPIRVRGPRYWISAEGSRCLVA